LFRTPRPSTSRDLPITIGRIDQDICRSVNWVVLCKAAGGRPYRQRIFPLAPGLVHDHRTPHCCMSQSRMLIVPSIGYAHAGINIGQVLSSGVGPVHWRPPTNCSDCWHRVGAKMLQLKRLRLRPSLNAEKLCRSRRPLWFNTLALARTLPFPSQLLVHQQARVTV
jgi:hypothetical protein